MIAKGSVQRNMESAATGALDNDVVEITTKCSVRITEYTKDKDPNT